MLLSLENVTVHYNKAEALKGISIRVAEGIIVTLIGSNGAGKTTTLRAISGLIPLTSGEIRLKDARIDGLPPHRIVGMGIAHVPEGRHVFPRMSILQNLRLGAYLRDDRQKVNEDLEQVLEYFPKLRERAKQRAGSLSGGEQQMLAIGRGLMNNPVVLMLDEPSLGLAPLIVDTVADIIETINRARKITIVLVEQNAHMALRLATQGYVLETGKVVLEGAAQEIQRDEGVRAAYLGK